MGGRGGGPNTSALGQALKKADSSRRATSAAPVATDVAKGPGIERLKPRQMRPGMWMQVRQQDNSLKWVQIGSIRNKGRAGTYTSGQFDIRDNNGEVIATLSPNGKGLIDTNRS